MTGNRAAVWATSAKNLEETVMDDIRATFVPGLCKIVACDNRNNWVLIIISAAVP